LGTFSHFRVSYSYRGQPQPLMLEPLATSRLPIKAFIISATLLSLVVCFALIVDLTGISFARKPPPPLPVVAACGDVGPGMSRIGEPGKIQFDVLTKDFNIWQGGTDAPPLVYGFDLALKGEKSFIEISYGPPPYNRAKDLARVFRSHIEERPIFDSSGQRIGTDEWEYLSGGKRRRRVHFRGYVTATYPFVDPEEARVFDQVINSACISTTPK